MVQDRINLIKNKYKNHHITISKNIIDEIIKESNYNEYGARKIDKIIKQDLEDNIITEIINENLQINIKHLKEKQLT